MELQKEQQEESKRALHQFYNYHNLDSMDSGGQNLWNVIDIRAMSKFFFFNRSGNLHMTAVLETLSVGQ